MSSTKTAHTDHTDHAKGRHADTPTDIPAPGWKEILLRVFKEFSNDRVMLIAAGTTFYLLLAMVPTLTALVSLYGLFADPAGVQQQMAFIQDFMPGGGQEILGEQLARLSSQPNSGLGFALAISLGLAFWSSNAGMKAMFEAMNVAYGEQEKRGFVKLTLVSLAFTVGGIVMLLALIGVVVILPLVVGFLGMGGMGELIVRFGSTAILILAAMVGLSALYRWGPSRSEAQWKWITPGAAVAVIVAAIASLLFSWYVSNFGSYNETYGSLGAIIGFMTWLWIMVAFLIIGAEINAEMEHQTGRDTTTGPAEPMGVRGAQMADTVADGPDDTDDQPGVGIGVNRKTGADQSVRASAVDEASRQDRISRDLHPSGDRGEAFTRINRGRERDSFSVAAGLVLMGAVALTMSLNRKSRSEADEAAHD